MDAFPDAGDKKRVPPSFPLFARADRLFSRCFSPGLFSPGLGLSEQFPARAYTAFSFFPFLLPAYINVRMDCIVLEFSLFSAQEGWSPYILSPPCTLDGVSRGSRSSPTYERSSSSFFSSGYSSRFLRPFSVSPATEDGLSLTSPLPPFFERGC